MFTYCLPFRNWLSIFSFLAAKQKTQMVLMFFLFGAFSDSLYAATEDELKAMQQALNAGVLAKPFSVEDEAKIDEYIKQSMKKDLKPIAKAPSYWQPGYTCANIASYGWRQYRNCRYYYRYYGRYW